jgi:hypothetical protein
MASGFRYLVLVQIFILINLKLLFFLINIDNPRLVAVPVAQYFLEKSLGRFFISL